MKLYTLLGNRFTDNGKEMFQRVIMETDSVQTVLARQDYHWNKDTNKWELKFYYNYKLER